MPPQLIWYDGGPIDGCELVRRSYIWQREGRRDQRYTFAIRQHVGGRCSWAAYRGTSNRAIYDDLAPDLPAAYKAVQQLVDEEFAAGRQSHTGQRTAKNRSQ